MIDVALWVLYCVALVGIANAPLVYMARRDRQRARWQRWRLPDLDLRESWRDEIRRRAR